MADLIICDRTSEGKCIRKRITGLNLTENVDHLKSKLSAEIEKPVSDFDLVYCGQCLREETSLESCGLRSGSTLHALARNNEEIDKDPEAGKPSSIEVKNMRTSLGEALFNPAYRSIVESIMNSPERLHAIVNDIPGLDTYPETLSLFHDVELLRILIHPGNIRRVIKNHPCLPQVAERLARAVKEEGNKAEFVRSTSGSYSLDHMSDDEDNAGASGSGGQPITANQLAAALAAATGSPRVPGSAGTQPGTSQSQSISTPGQMITTDFFQQAILQAQSASLTNQLAQMRDMGITDENVAKQALQATNGDLQAAIELIFSGGLN